jgi:6-phosphogluconate dehydrogenase
MVHNGIEQGMLGVLDEVWELMFKCLHMKLGAIADVFERWTAEEQSELVGRFPPPSIPALIRR